ncbi:acyl-homoserine-lactone synthase [uncultured Roseobacter sp.]|uniref:acyl-homoserine-lactone synthase n=1 Tax=uncultured Roseobacter sp. TaxID=114847 RepID=UPI00260EAC50|nr:acyl-homoserine-lactone synthase [uncultured Roseobacter sp.]
MLHFLTGAELRNVPELRKSMFRDRKIQFIDRLGWGLKVTQEQLEIDEYDRDDAFYVINSDGKNRHVGSMRLLPTSLPNMIQEHFNHVIPGISFASEKVWECTRLCSAKGASPKVAISVLAGAAKFMGHFEINAFLGLFDKRMHRTYRRLGISPMVIGSSDSVDGLVSVGLWSFNHATYKKLVEHSAYTGDEIEGMFGNNSLYRLGAKLPMKKQVRTPSYQTEEPVA